jgi:hypothetical protein
MPNDKVVSLAEPTLTMTFAEGLAFIERTRRQLDRFDELPHTPDWTIRLEDAAKIRGMCDDLEGDIRKSLSGA